MPVTIGKFEDEADISTGNRKSFNEIFDIVRDDTFPNVVPTATSALAAAQLLHNGIDVAAISPDIATFLREATVRGIMQRLLSFSLCQVS